MCPHDFIHSCTCPCTVFHAFTLILLMCGLCHLSTAVCSHLHLACSLGHVSCTLTPSSTAVHACTWHSIPVSSSTPHPIPHPCNVWPAPSVHSCMPSSTPHLHLGHIFMHPRIFFHSCAGLHHCL